jgi:hypothetical protein
MGGVGMQVAGPAQSRSSVAEPYLLLLFKRVWQLTLHNDNQLQSDGSDDRPPIIIRLLDAEAVWPGLGILTCQFKIIIILIELSETIPPMATISTPETWFHNAYFGTKNRRSALVLYYE